MSEWNFYENIFEVSKDLLKCQLVPWAIKKLILEMDRALREWRTARERDNTQDVNNENEDYRKIDSRKLSEIYEIFRDRTVERDRYLEVFPKYKTDTLKTIGELDAEADGLHESLQKYVNTPNEFANAAGALSGGLRLLSLVTSLSPGLSFVMNAASMTNGAVRTATTATKHMVIENRLENAVKSIDNHKRQFKDMNRWFTYDDCLTKSIEAAIGSETTEVLFRKFKELCENLDNFRNNHPTTVTALKVITALSKVLINADFKVMVAYSVTAALFQIFWLHYGSRWTSDWNIGARPFERLKTLSVAGMYGAHTYFSLQRLTNPSDSFYSNTSIGAAVGLAIDLIPPLLDAKKKTGKSATSDQVKNIRNVIKKLREELNLFQRVYDTLKAERENMINTQASTH